MNLESLQRGGSISEAWGAAGDRWVRKEEMDYPWRQAKVREKRDPEAHW